jgi:hypothetical protein
MQAAAGSPRVNTSLYFAIILHYAAVLPPLTATI